MALNDKKVQELQVQILKILKEKKTGDPLTMQSGTKYQLIHKVNETTQAIAVAPIVNGKPDYSQTTIVAAGTQDMNHDVNQHVAESLTNAAVAMTGLTEQTKDIRRFYKETLVNSLNILLILLYYKGINPYSLIGYRNGGQ